MGIFCEMNLFKPSDAVYHPGQVIRGLIKYELDKPMEVESITTSLKGIGRIKLVENPGGKHQRTYTTKEVYVDIDDIVQDKQNVIPVGTHEISFHFYLPNNVPSTITYKKYFRSYKVKCNIQYYIRIKFESSGVFSFNKHFKKEITVLSGITPSLLKEPVVYGESKKLIRLFSTKDSTVTIRATILNSIIPFSGKIEVQYEVENNSHVLVKSVKTKLVEGYKCKAKGHKKVIYIKTVPDTNIKTQSINCEDTQNIPVDINVPSNAYSLEHAQIISRYYFVRIKAQLPMMRRNAVLDIPVQIGVIDENIDDGNFEQLDDEIDYDSPPSYWEAMGETKKDDIYATDDELDDYNKKSEM